MKKSILSKIGFSKNFGFFINIFGSSDWVVLCEWDGIDFKWCLSISTR